MPDSIHANCSSLPTLRDVRGYEEKDPRVMRALETGYPRFVTHRYVRDLAAALGGERGLSAGRLHLVRSRKAADELCSWMGAGAEASILDFDAALYGVALADDKQSHERAHRFIQHTGCGVSSRQAERELVARGALADPARESVFCGDATGEVRRRLGDLYGCGDAGLVLCNSGMNAFFAAFKAARKVQTPRRRRTWVQLGWLYLDTGRILEHFMEPEERLERHWDATDLRGLAALLDRIGDDLAGLVVEAPGNPLVQTCALAEITGMVRARGGLLIADPTIASAYNVDLLPHCDVLVNSLTKYAGHAGDTMLGAVALNPAAPDYAALAEAIRDEQVAPFEADLARLADQMQDAEHFCRRVARSTEAMAAWFEAQPAVKRVHWAGAPVSRDRYLALARGDAHWSAVITLDLNMPLERFYDRVACAKGPSFGTDFTLLCPFLYLAHYDLVTRPEGRRLLEGVGLNPELVRVSVGLEPLDQLQAHFAEALS